MKNIIKTAFILGLIGGSYLWAEGALAEPAPGYHTLSAERVSKINAMQRKICAATSGMTWSEKQVVLEGANTVFLAAENGKHVRDEDLGMAHLMSACVLGGNAARNIDRVYAKADR